MADYLLLGFGLLAGIKHGIDLDHIAAISDITSSQENSIQGLFYSCLYGLGHGLMVIILGGLLLLLGAQLPPEIDILFGKIVGITLIILSFYVLLSIIKDRENFKIKGKWGMIFTFFDIKPKFASKTSFGIGMIHGFGAETPTQIGALLILLKTGGGIKGFVFLLIFVLGIFISNLMVAAFSIYGYKKVKENKRAYMIIGLLTALFSLGIGIGFVVK